MLTTMGRLYLSRAGRALPGALAAVAILAAATASAQPAPPSGFSVFLRSVLVGREQIDVEQTAAGWTISSTGQFN